MNNVWGNWPTSSTILLECRSWFLIGGFIWVVFHGIIPLIVIEVLRCFRFNFLSHLLYGAYWERLGYGNYIAQVCCSWTRDEGCWPSLCSVKTIEALGLSWKLKYCSRNHFFSISEEYWWLTYRMVNTVQIFSGRTSSKVSCIIHHKNYAPLSQIRWECCTCTLKLHQPQSYNIALIILL